MDGNFDVVDFADGRVLIRAEELPRAVTAAKDAEHGDWKTAMVRSFPSLKAGDTVRLHDVWRNLYGRQARVEVDGVLIDVSPSALNWNGALQ